MEEYKEVMFGVLFVSTASALSSVFYASSGAIPYALKSNCNISIVKHLRLMCGGTHMDLLWFFLSGLKDFPSMM